jgi:uncharacterized protein YjlB
MQKRNGVNKEFETEYYQLKDDGIFPNSYLPVVLYKQVLDLPVLLASHYIKRLFQSNNWSNIWKSGIYEYNHYHSNTHEVMGVYKGKTVLLIGGDKGVEVRLEKGDVLIIPAGTAHKNLGKEHSVKCVGAYPDGKNFDMNYGKPEERPQAGKNIYKVKLPSKDPVFGKHGRLENFWKL